MVNKLSMNISSIPDDEYQQGYCPDAKCNERLVYKKSEKEIVCYFCGNKMPVQHLQCKSIIEYGEAKRLKRRIDNFSQRTNPEWSRVNGISQFRCKLISPLFSKYGISQDWVSVPLVELGFKDGFDEKLIKDRAFFIQKGFISSPGYGIDESSANYLFDTINKIASFDTENHLIPLTISKNGVSLLQCFSRALIGREIFWHPLGQLLKEHFKAFSNFYLEHLDEFDISEEEWTDVLSEYAKCTNEESSKESTENAQIVGMFAFSNILCRPVILLNDGTKNTKNGADQFGSQTFLPILRSYEDLRKNSKLIKPLVVAWSDKSKSSRVVPLVGIKGFPAPKLPRSFLPKTFLSEKCELDKFIEFDTNNFCVVADGRQVKYLNTMIRIMEETYLGEAGVSPLVIADYVEDILEEVDCFSKYRDIKDIIVASDEKRLFRCLICWCLTVAPKFPEDLLDNCGFVYRKIQSLSGRLVHNEKYTLKPLGSFYYDEKEDFFVVAELFVRPPCFICKYNSNQLRLMISSGKVFFENGDHSRIPALKSKCKRRMKHFWDSRFYDDVPLVVQVNLNVAGAQVEASFPWFEFESEQQNKSNIVDVAQKLIRQYYNRDFTDVESVTQQCYDALLMTHIPTGCICPDRFWSFERELNLTQISEDEYDYSVFLLNFTSNCSMFLEDSKKVQNKTKEEAKHIDQALVANETSSKRRSIVFYPAQCFDDREIVNMHQVILSNGQKNYIAFEKRHTYSEIVQKISETFLIWSRMIRFIICPCIGLIRAYSRKVCLKGMLYVQLKEDELVLKDFANSISVSNQPLSKSLRMYSLRYLYDLTLGTSIFWYFVINSSEMFVGGGTVYEFVNDRWGLVGNWHYAVPGVLPNKKLVYNADVDRLEFCTLSAHFEINHEIRREMMEKTFTFNEMKEAELWLEREMNSKRILAAANTIHLVPAH